MSERAEAHAGRTAAPLVIVVTTQPEGNFAPTVRALQAALDHSEIVIWTGRDGAALDDLATATDAVVLEGATLAGLIARAQPDGAGTAYTRHVLVVTAPVLVPLPFCDAAAAALDADMRIATVSFLSNNAGLLSTPQRNEATFHRMGSHDQQTVTDALRDQALSPQLVGIPAPGGSITLLSRHALSALDGLHAPATLTAGGQVVDFALSANDRGFVCAVDRTTFVLSPTDLGATQQDPLFRPGDYNRLVERHRHLPEVLSRAGASNDSPMAIAVSTSAAVIDGLSIAIDGRCLGDKEMGTQVQTLALANELAKRSDVKVVTIATNGPIPPYATKVFAQSKVRHVWLNNENWAQLPECDVLHRPYQPDTLLPITAWRGRARRVLVTLQDVIAYQVGAYAASSHAWLDYRTALWSGAEQADGVIAISHDTVEQIRFEMLNVEPDRLFVVANGTDHLAGVDELKVPDALLRRGFAAERFLFVLGANYAHKQRDLAVAAWSALRQTHPDVALVMVGANVPHGSSRLAESAVAPAAPAPLYVLPDVASAERNWLLRHAEVVLYPTSAEGFGLVPFEAAHFGTPTAQVNFGPLDEVNHSDIAAATWSARDFAGAIATLIDDPDARATQVASTLASGTAYTWSATASGLASAYRDILARPPRNAYSLSQP